MHVLKHSKINANKLYKEQRKPKETRSQIKINTGINALENKETIKDQQNQKLLFFLTSLLEYNCFTMLC